MNILSLQHGALLYDGKLVWCLEYSRHIKFFIAGYSEFVGPGRINILQERPHVQRCL
jgi:hypothetical protein